MPGHDITAHGLVNEREAAIRAAGEAIFRHRYAARASSLDRLFAGLMGAQWLFAVALSLVISPYTWAGRSRSLHAHVYMAVFLGAALAALPALFARRFPGQPVTRLTIGISQMLWSALFIDLTGGRIETHFHIFGSLAFLAFYRDYRVLVSATLVIVLDHGIRQFLSPQSVYGVDSPEWWRFLEHGAWVLFEDAFLFYACVRGGLEMREDALHQARVELTERAAQEMDIAARIQTAILPRRAAVRGLDIAARMVPASDVGGDYYDILPTEDGCWIGIGDVAGHGLKAGLVMLQVQSAVQALATEHPRSVPRDLLNRLNRVMFENIHERMLGDDYMTLNLIRYHDDGRLVIAGAHEEIIVFEAALGRCRKVPVAGTWIGVQPSIERVTVETTVALSPGDLVVLYTDGLTEAMNGAGEQLGQERIMDVVERHSSEPVARIRDRLFDLVDDWTGRAPDDDVTVLLLRKQKLSEQRSAAAMEVS